MKPVVGLPSIVKSLGLTDEIKTLSLNATVIVETWLPTSAPAAGVVEVTSKV